LVALVVYAVIFKFAVVPPFLSRSLRPKWFDKADFSAFRVHGFAKKRPRAERGHGLANATSVRFEAPVGLGHGNRVGVLHLLLPR
jgi:hypothetical protein